MVKWTDQFLPIVMCPKQLYDDFTRAKAIRGHVRTSEYIRYLIRKDVEELQKNGLFKKE